MSQILIKNAQIVNEGRIVSGDVLIKDGFIEKIGGEISPLSAAQEINAEGLHLLPGVIDDQVHFREPGLTHKADIGTESRAAVAGGTTSFMEMPNTNPPAFTRELLEQKYRRAAEVSPANYSFFMGTSNDNLEEIKQVNPKEVCGVKIFMGSSTGNLLVDNPHTLEEVFRQSPTLIATHCEDEATILARTAEAKARWGEDVPFDQHPIIRDVEACYKSSALAIDLARKHNTRLHILHISTAEELALFQPGHNLADKRITSEVCVHHLWFDASQYADKGAQIKCNPAIKEARHKQALLQALKEGRLDIIATDHAPHTWEEKQGTYFKAPSGLPLVQHSLQMMLEFVHDGHLDLAFVSGKMSHAVADCFQIDRRGYIREGYWADLVLVDLNKPQTVAKNNLLYKCGWSPLEDYTFRSSIHTTIVSGQVAWAQGQVNEAVRGHRMAFDR